jgi:hypothetical protein
MSGRIDPQIIMMKFWVNNQLVSDAWNNAE